MKPKKYTKGRRDREENEERLITKTMWSGAQLETVNVGSGTGCRRWGAVESLGLTAPKSSVTRRAFPNSRSLTQDLPRTPTHQLPKTDKAQQTPTTLSGCQP